MLSSPPPATGPPVFTNEYKDGNAAPHKWVIPVVVVGVTTLVSAVLLLAVWWKGRHGGGHQPYINVHMIKMMAESGARSGQRTLQGCVHRPRPGLGKADSPFWVRDTHYCNASRPMWVSNMKSISLIGTGLPQAFVPMPSIPCPPALSSASTSPGARRRGAQAAGRWPWGGAAPGAATCR